MESTHGTHIGQKEQATIARADWHYLACPKIREFDNLSNCKTSLVEPCPHSDASLLTAAFLVQR